MKVKILNQTIAGFFALILLCPGQAMGQAIPIPCDGAFYLAHTKETEGPTALLRIQYNAQQDNYQWDTLIADAGRRIFPIGYRVTDQLIYGLDPDSWDLLTMDGGGNVSVLQNLIGRLDTSYYFNGGCITPKGEYFILIGSNKETEKAEVFYFLGLNDLSRPAGKFSLVGLDNVSIGDLAAHPFRRTQHGFDALGKSLLYIGYFSGLVTNHQFSSEPGVGNMGATFFDREGNLFGYGRNAGNVNKDHMLFKMDALFGYTEAVQTGPSGSITDGCSCPYTLPFEKQISPKRTLFCDTLTITYRWDNRTGAGFIRQSLIDTFPPELTIVDVPYLPFQSIVEEGPGSNMLRIAIGDFLLGPDSIIVKALVNGSPVGSFGSRGYLGSFPKALGTYIGSDDPDTEIEGDPSLVHIVPLEVTLSGKERLCPGESGTLTASITPTGVDVKYLWSDGSGEPELSVSEEGWYSLEVEAECGKGIDSLYIEVPLIPLDLDLGAEQIIQQGENLGLNFQTNAAGPFIYAWAANPADESLCEECPYPNVRPLVSTRYTLNLTDEYGCIATDSVLVKVDGEQEIEANNVFTPNGDGINEVFYFYGKGLVVIRTLQVFDRWGQQVHYHAGGQLNDPSHGWDGKLKGGQTRPIGAYYWMVELEYPDAHIEVRKGQVTLMK